MYGYDPENLSDTDIIITQGKQQNGETNDKK